MAMHHRGGENSDEADAGPANEVEESKDMRRIVILGMELKGEPWLQFVICVAGVFACSCLHDFLQELVFLHKSFDYGWFMTLCELGVIVVAAAAVVVAEGRVEEITTTPWRRYLGLTFVLAITQGFGSAALSYVNFPVKVVIKSSKLIPTMALGLLVLRRTYSFAEYSAAVMLCVGVAGFTLVDSSVSPKFHIVGVALLVGAVLGDSMTANLQERILRQMDCSKEQMMFASNLMAAGWVVVLILFTGELSSALSLIVKEPMIGWQLLLQSLAQYLSVSFYLALVQRFGGVVAVCVTSCRKILTICISFVVFSKPFSNLYIPTGLLALIGISLSVVAKQKHPASRDVVFLQAAGVVMFFMFVSMWFMPK